MAFHRLLIAAFVVVLPVLGACSDDDEPDDAATTTTSAKPAGMVEMKGVKFTPETLTIKAGQTVEWQFNDGDTEHRVQGATFASEVQSSGTFTHTFDEPGTSTYQCTIHPDKMKGIIVVE